MLQVKIFEGLRENLEVEINEWLSNNYLTICVKKITQSFNHNDYITTISIFYEKLV